MVDRVPLSYIGYARSADDLAIQAHKGIAATKVVATIYQAIAISAPVVNISARNGSEF